MNDEIIEIESKRRREAAADIEASTSSTEQQNPIEAPEAAIDQSSSPMLKLDIDCLEELFEWLSIDELLALRPTCKRLKRAVDYYIREYYPAFRIGFGRIILSATYEAPHYEDEDKFQMIRSLDTVSLKLIKQISVWSDELKTEQIDAFKRVLNQLERLEIGAYTIDGGFYESILKFCTNLSYLSIHKIFEDKIAGENNEWFHHQYPTIKHIELDDRDPGRGPPRNGDEVVELMRFFQLNPNIQIFSTTFNIFWVNRNSWLDSNIKLDRLDVEGECYYESPMSQICGLFNELYDQGFYQRIHIYATYPYEQDDINQIAAVKGLEKLYLSCVSGDFTLPIMPKLRQFCISLEDDIDKLKNPIDTYANVERNFYWEITSNKLVDVLRQVPKVREIKVNQLLEGIYFKDDILDVAALNSARKELVGACKTTIYVQEYIFIATKWANNKTQFDMIELKRAEAVEWIHQYRT